MVLCQYAHWDLLKAWIAVGGDIWAKDEQDCTLLSYALRSGRASAIGAIEYLESLGLSLESEVSSNGRTPLMLAAASCRHSLRLLRYVLARGFAMDARDKRGRTPLLYACEGAFPISPTPLAASWCSLG